MVPCWRAGTLGVSSDLTGIGAENRSFFAVKGWKVKCAYGGLFVGCGVIGSGATI